MNGSACAGNGRDIRMQVYVVTYSITSFVISMCIYYFVPNEVTILQSVDVPGRAGVVVYPGCVSSVRLFITTCRRV